MTKNNLERLVSLSTQFEVSRSTYQFIISDGYRWDIFRKVFERKKWYIEGTEIGLQFISHSLNATKENYEREVYLCYSFALGMSDKADLPTDFCAIYESGRTDVSWTVYAPGGLPMHPLYMWESVYHKNKRKMTRIGRKHVQSMEEISARLESLSALVQFLLRCT